MLGSSSQMHNLAGKLPIWASKRDSEQKLSQRTPIPTVCGSDNPSGRDPTSLLGPALAKKTQVRATLLYLFRSNSVLDMEAGFGKGLSRPGRSDENDHAFRLENYAVILSSWS